MYLRKGNRIHLKDMYEIEFLNSIKSELLI
jgi:hypothetical protein